MSVTELLLRPLLRQDGAKPLITHFDDAAGTRIELSRATMANWAAKTANWLHDELDVEPGTEVAVLLPTHWQTVGVLLGAWWCGAAVTADPQGAEIAFVARDGSAPGAGTVAVVSLDPMGRGLTEAPPAGAVDYVSDARVHGDDFTPWEPVPGSAPAFLESTVDDLVQLAKQRAGELGITGEDRVLSTLDWNTVDGLVDGLLAPLSVGAPLVQCTNLDPAQLSARRATERTTVELGVPTG